MNKCLNCNSKTSNPKYCDRSCAAKMLNKMKPKRVLTNKCIACGALISKRSTYCKAHKNYRNGKPLLLNSDMTIGELKTARAWQKSVRIRENARAVFAQKRITSCERCGYALHIEVCHVKAVSSFDLSATLGEVNHPDNLMGLCPNCHWELDNGHWSVNETA